MLVDLLQVPSFIVELMGLPEFPDDAQPAIGQAAVGVALGMTTCAGLSEIGGGPVGLLD